jgi:hypothetical protein
LTCRAKGLFYSLGQQDQIIFIDRTSLASLTDTDQYLFAAKWLCGPASLNDVQEGDLLSGKSLTAFRALAAAANLCAIFDRSRVDNA